MPRILGFTYTDRMAELKMESCGDSVQQFISKVQIFSKMEPYHKACIMFDMLRQLSEPLSVLHRAGYVHGDIKPDNICMRPWKHVVPKQKFTKGRTEKFQPYISEYQFTLIDFGIISKFKIKKANKTYNSHVGNLMFSSLRGLKCQQTRYQDDFESLLFLTYQFVCGRLPWDIEFREQMRSFKGGLNS
jgi:serine/threonine protein kinase